MNKKPKIKINPQLDQSWDSHADGMKYLTPDHIGKDYPEFSLCIIFEKDTNNLYHLGFTTSCIRDGKLDPQYLVSTDEKVILATPMWSILYGQ